MIKTCYTQGVANKQINRLIRLLLLLFVIVQLALCSQANANELRCFDLDDYSRIEYSISQGNICKDQLNLYIEIEGANASELLLFEKKVADANRTITSYQAELKTQQSECDDRVAAAKPGFFKTIFGNFTNIAIGAVAGLAIGVVVAQ